MHVPVQLSSPLVCSDKSDSHLNNVLMMSSIDLGGRDVKYMSGKEQVKCP